MAQPVLPRTVQRLIDEFSRLPGIGPKSASRLTFFLLRAADNQAGELAIALQELKERTRLCSVCFNITEEDPCPICADDARDGALLCIVEEPLDVLAIERSRAYSGRYHVLHGAISPMEGKGPDDLKIPQLVKRLQQGNPAPDGGDAPIPVKEILLATNPNLEGDATAMYIARLVKPLGIRVTRLAHGLPVGGDLEYADDITLGRALAGRSEL